MTMTFAGRSSATGTITDTLHALGALDPKTGKPYSEALVLGASGGIAFGYFVFEYKGAPPHVSLLTRNTFGPFERSLDNLAIKREVRETTNEEKGEKNLRDALDSGAPAIVLADMYSMPYRGLNSAYMWYMAPLAVVGQEGDDYLVADGSSVALRVTAQELMQARARVKKDRFRVTTLEAPDETRVADGLISGLKTCIALFLDKPPAGSPNNFGMVGMRHFAKMLTDKGNAKGWARTFEPGPRLAQALAGSHGQPGVWDWIETWGTRPGADRDTFADFLEEAAVWIGNPTLAGEANSFRASAKLWSQLADQAMPDSVPEFKALKALKRKHKELWIQKGAASNAERATIREEQAALIKSLQPPQKLAPFAESIQSEMAATVLKIADLEEQAVKNLRSSLG